MSDIEIKIRSAVGEAVKEAFGIEADESVLNVETPRDKKMGDY